MEDIYAPTPGTIRSNSPFPEGAQTLEAPDIVCAQESESLTSEAEAPDKTPDKSEDLGRAWVTAHTSGIDRGSPFPPMLSHLRRDG